jgi:predicted PurR-regulated permease PerM
VARSTAEIKSLIVWAVALALAGIVLLWWAYLARGALLIIYVSWLLALGFSPLVRVIERQKILPIGSKRFPRWLAILILYSTILGFLTLVGFLAVPPLVAQARSLAIALPDMFDKAQTYLIEHGWLHERITLRQAVEHAPGGQAVGTVAGAMVNVVGGIFAVITTLILTFYLLIDADTLRKTFVRLFPVERRAQVEAATRDIMVKVSAWMTGQLLMGALIGVTAGIGLWAMGVPYFSVLALISGIGELIPVLGPILSSIPAILIAATISYKLAIFVALFFVVQQQIESHVLVPKIMSRQVGVSPVVVISSLLIGGQLLGILGALLAIPTAAVVLVVLSEITGEGGSKEIEGSKEGRRVEGGV